MFIEEYAMVVTSKLNLIRRKISRRRKVAEISLMFIGLCPGYRFTNPSASGIIEKGKLTNTNVWVTGESLTEPQLFTLILLTVIDVALLIAAIAWHRHKKGEKESEKDFSTELHENHFGS